MRQTMPHRSHTTTHAHTHTDRERERERNTSWNPQGNQSQSFSSTCLFCNKQRKKTGTIPTDGCQPKVKLRAPLFCQSPKIPPPPLFFLLFFWVVLHQTRGIGAITPAYLKPPKCVEQVAHNALLLLFGSRSQDGRFHNAFKWHIRGRRLAGLPRTISPGAREEQQAACKLLPFSTKEKEKEREGEDVSQKRSTRGW